MHWLDPDYLPEVSGTVKQFLINPHGEIDGIIFEDGTEVHFPPHMSPQISKSIAKGQKVTVKGVRPRSADVIAGVSIQSSQGKPIVDDGPPKEKPGKHKGRHASKSKIKSAEVIGVVQRPLHGPKGEVRGVLLTNGETVRFPKHEAKRLASLTAKGAKFAARGEVIITPFATVIKAEEIGASSKSLRKVAHKAPKHEKHREHAH